MKYFVKRPNETEEFSFAATLEEIQTGYKNGEIQPEWAVRKEIEGSYDWITIQQLCGPEASSISLASAEESAKSKRRLAEAIVGAAFFGVLCAVIGLLIGLIGNSVENMPIVGPIALKVGNGIVGPSNERGFVRGMGRDTPLPTKLGITVGFTITSGLFGAAAGFAAGFAGNLGARPRSQPPIQATGGDKGPPNDAA